MNRTGSPDMVVMNNQFPETEPTESCAWPRWPGRGTGPDGGVPATPLTQAERRVMFLVQQGLSNKEISDVLGRAEPTIKNQLASCLKKYQVPSRARLMAISRFSQATDAG